MRVSLEERRKLAVKAMSDLASAHAVVPLPFVEHKIRHVWLVALASALPIAWLGGFMQGRMSRRFGLCPTCAYDRQHQRHLSRVRLTHPSHNGDQTPTATDFLKMSALFPGPSPVPSPRR